MRGVMNDEEKTFFTTEAQRSQRACFPRRGSVT
jgi:hypothetical protein